MAYFPSPTGITPLDAPLSIESKLTFDTGNPSTDRSAELTLEFADILYDQVTTISMDLGVTATGNDISTPAAADLVPVYKPTYDPADVYVVGILLTCEFGEAAIYLATDLTTTEYFDPPDVDGLIPIPLIEGGWFMYVNDNTYPVASNWQSQVDTPIFIGEILAATFLPTRITGYVFLKNVVVP